MAPSFPERVYTAAEVEQARRLDEFYHRFGMLLLILIIVTRVTTYIVGIPVMILHGLLTGPVILGLVPPRSRSQAARLPHRCRRPEGKGQSRR